MTWAAHVTAVRESVRERPWLRPLFHHVLDIPRRLYLHDPRLFLVFNKCSLTPVPWEVHSLGQSDDTYAMTVRFMRLDERLLRDVRRHDVRARGRAILDEMRAAREQAEAKQAKDRRDTIKDLAKETRTLFARNYWDSAGYGGRVSFGWEREAMTHAGS